MARTTPGRAQAREEPSLLGALGRLDEVALATLLTVRPDLADPPPRSLIDLAARADAPASVNACQETLDLASHQVHAALCLLPAPATVGQLSQLLVVDEHDPDLAAALRSLVDRAMVVRDGDRVRLLPGLELRFPAGLGPPVAVALAAQSAVALANCARRLGVPAGTTKAATLASITAALAEPGQVARLLKGAPAGAAELVRRLAHDGPEGYAPGAAYNGDKSAAGWLANRAMVAPVGWDTVLLVREVGLAVRGGNVFPELALHRPDLSLQPVDGAGADRGAAERALRLVADVSTILDGWALDPPRLLKAGGLGIQAVRRAGKAVDRPEVSVARVIELAAAAGLVGIDDATNAALPLPAYDRWSALPVAGRWSHLVGAWIAWDLHVSAAGALDQKHKPIAPLMIRAPEPHAAARRARVLAMLAEVPAGTAVSFETAYDRMLWDAPVLWSGGPGPAEMLVAWTLAECELLGLCGLGSLSTWGRLAAVGDLEGAEAALGRIVPEATSRFVVQADLTALAPAELVRPVLIELASMADLESRGAATLYRFTEASVRRSYEAGRGAPEILAFLEAHAAKGVPQALTYLVNDVGRRFGQLRVTAMSCCVRSDDPSLLAEVVASRAGQRLGLRLLAPTVAAATADAPAVLDGLRAAGYVPAEEGSDGALVIRRPTPRRAVPDRRVAALTGRRPGASAGFGPVGDPFSPAAHSSVGPATPPGPAAPGGPEDRSPAAIAARLVRSNRQGRANRAAEAAAPSAQPPARRPEPERLLSLAPPPRQGLTGSPFEVADAFARPATIARGPLAVSDLLDRALIEDWPVRLAYTSKKGRTTQLTGSVLDVGDRDVVFELISWESRVLALSRIEWARVLTEAEEDALA